MNKEKLEYLRKNTVLSPIAKVRMSFLKSRGASEEDLEKIEYEARFQTYQKGWDKTWQNLSWGEKEDESLASFADSALEQAVNDEKGKTR